MVEFFFYLIENYNDIAQCPDAPTLARRLSYHGFESQEVHAAVHWIENLRHSLPIEGTQTYRAGHIRSFHPLELRHIGADNLHLMLTLEHNGSIDAAQREIVLERCMSLPSDCLDDQHFGALLLTILWAEAHDISDALLLRLMDDGLDAALH